MVISLLEASQRFDAVYAFGDTVALNTWGPPGW
jgi:hypothetical protein